MTHLLLLTLLVKISLSVKYCYDYQECKSESITLQDTVYCYGRRSCESASISIGVVNHVGYANVILSSRLSGYLATIESPNVEISGEGGASNAQITATTVNAYSKHATSSAEIKSTGDELTVNMAAYQAGYGTDIICTNGQTCTLDCVYEKACYNTNFYCYEGSTCIFHSHCPDDGSETDYCLNIYQTTDSGLTDVGVREIYLKNKNRIPVDTPDPDIDPITIPNDDSIPNDFSHYVLSFNDVQFSVLLLCALLILISIGLCLYNMSNIMTAKRFIFQKH